MTIMKTDRMLSALNIGRRIQTENQDNNSYMHMVDGTILNNDGTEVCMESLPYTDETKEYVRCSEWSKRYHKINDLIKELQRLQQIHGDIGVCVQSGDYGEDQNYITDVYPEAEHFVEEDRLIITLRN